MGIELHARVAEGRRGDPIGQRLVVEYPEEAVEFVADTALPASVHDSIPYLGRLERLSAIDVAITAGKLMLTIRIHRLQPRQKRAMRRPKPG